MKQKLRLRRELGLKSVVRPQKPGYERGRSHKIFENRLKQELYFDAINQKWCTDFTYLFLSGMRRYDCAIIDLYNQSVVASITDCHITSDLAIRTLQKALDSQPIIKGELILHSNPRSQYTSKVFVKSCKSAHVTQGISKAGNLYNNALMERYFNTLKNEYLNLYELKTDEMLYQAVEEFAHVSYNHVCPHSYNGCRTLYQRRMAA